MQHDRHWTVRDRHELPDDGLRYECLDGSLVVSPPPVARHEAALQAFAEGLRAQVPRAWSVRVGEAVRLGPDWRVPDLIVVPAAGGAGSVTDPLVAHEPSDVVMAVEVVSHSTARHDRVVKPAEYADAGITHYWRLETDPDYTLFGATLLVDPVSGPRYVPGHPATPFPVRPDLLMDAVRRSSRTPGAGRSGSGWARGGKGSGTPWP